MVSPTRARAPKRGRRLAEDVHTDAGDRLRVVLAWLAAALVPVWLMLTATFAQLGLNDDAFVVEVMSDGSAQVVNERSVLAQGLEAGLAAAAALVVGAMVLVPVVWAVVRLMRARAPQVDSPYDAKLLEGATWNVELRRGEAVDPTDPTARTNPPPGS